MAGADRELSILPVLSLCNRSTVEPYSSDKPRWYISGCRNNSRDLVDESHLLGLAGEDHTIVLGLEPLHGVLLGETVGEPNVSNLLTSVLDIHAWAPKDNIEVHSVDTNAWVVPK